jgi:hypothetical protein
MPKREPSGGKDPSPGKGRPRFFKSPRKVTLVLEGEDAEELSRYTGWRRSRDGRPVSQGAVLMEALKGFRLYREWKKDTKPATKQ